MSFRLKWSFKQFANFGDYGEHKKLLKYPYQFYLAILVKLLPAVYRKPIYLQLKNGFNIKIDEFMSIYIYKEIFVDGCYDNLPITSRNPSVIEVGANTGQFVLRIKSNYPHAQVVSFEPYPPNFLKLVETIDSNNIDDAKPIMKAVSDRPGQLKLYIHPTNIGGHSILRENAGNKYVTVDTTTLDEILYDHKIDVCDLLKLDCEGAELRILRSLTKETAQKIRTIIFEPTYSQYSVKDLMLDLEAIGYKVYNQKGLIIATVETD